MTYAELVKKAKTEVMNRPNFLSKNICTEISQTWIKSDHINLYAYMQGHLIENIEHGIDILLVGQDFGQNPDHENDVDCNNYRKRLEEVKRGKYKTTYNCTNAEDDGNKTNKRLRAVFKKFYGYDIAKPEKDKRIFFTNYSLEYRAGKEESNGTRNEKDRLLARDDSLFIDLVKVIKPKYIICLGSVVYDHVTKSNTDGKWKTQMHKGIPYFTRYSLNQDIRVFGVVHPSLEGSNAGKGNGDKIWKYTFEKIKNEQ